MISSAYQRSLVALVILAVLIPSIVCPPVKAGQEKKDHQKKNDHPSRNDETNLAYKHYLGQVRDALESDPEFVKRLKAMNMTSNDTEEYGLEYERYLKEIFTALEEDEVFKNKIMKDPELKANDISQHLEFVSHSVRTKLDEIKRTEVERLRALIHLKMQQLKEQGHKTQPGRGLEESIRHLLPDSEHVDINNPHSFEMRDLDRLIKKATNDLDELDKERKEDFKKYEMEKEHERRQKLAKMTPEERKKEEEHFQELQKKHKDHPKLHEPGSKAQLEEVWEGEDHMDKDSFDPQTFFKMHDIDEDGHLEPDEVEALVEREVSKAYEPGKEEDDLNEKYEEINRMREEMFKRYDKDHDGLISNEEFLGMTKTKDFEEDDGWKGLDDQEIFSPEELAEFEKEREAEEEPALYDKRDQSSLFITDKKIEPDIIKFEREEAADAGHHEQPGVVHMDQQQPAQVHPDQAHPPLIKTEQAHPPLVHPVQGQPDQAHPPLVQPVQGQGHPEGHVPPVHAPEHVPETVQHQPAAENHAPPQHPPPR